MSAVIEAAFHAGLSEAGIASFADDATIMHVRVITPSRISLARYRQRAVDGLRHPAHDDLRFADEMESGRKSVDVYDVHLPYPSIDVDGSDGWAPDLDIVAGFITTSRGPVVSTGSTAGG